MFMRVKRRSCRRAPDIRFSVMWGFKTLSGKHNVFSSTWPQEGAVSLMNISLTSTVGRNGHNCFCTGTEETPTFRLRSFTDLAELLPGGQTSGDMCPLTRVSFIPMFNWQSSLETLLWNMVCKYTESHYIALKNKIKTYICYLIGKLFILF